MQGFVAIEGGQLKWLFIIAVCAFGGNQIHSNPLNLKLTNYDKIKLGEQAYHS